MSFDDKAHVVYDNRPIHRFPQNKKIRCECVQETPTIVRGKEKTETTDLYNVNIEERGILEKNDLI